MHFENKNGHHKHIHSHVLASTYGNMKMQVISKTRKKKTNVLEVTDMRV